MWKKLWNRAVDSPVTNDSSVKLRQIEKKIFNTVKNEVGGCVWLGNADQNRDADVKVSKFVKMSFKNYEDKRAPADESFFKF